MCLFRNIYMVGLSFEVLASAFRPRLTSLAASRTSGETCTLFINRFRNLLDFFYMRSRECDNFEILVDLIVPDRLKDSLGGRYLKNCLAIEGKRLSATELAALVDVYKTDDVNYTPDGRYRGGVVNSVTMWLRMGHSVKSLHLTRRR